MSAAAAAAVYRSATLSTPSLLARLLDALELDDIHDKDDEAQNSEAHGQRYAGIFQHVHALVSVNTCIGPHTKYARV